MFERLSPVPPILLAAIALQESSCNPYTVGGAGEQGLMQITPDKCDGAPGGDCMNVVRIISPIPPVSKPLRSYTMLPGFQRPDRCQVPP